MIAALLVGVGLLAAVPPEDGAADDRSAYEAARHAAGRDAAAHRNLALWCESRGLTAERLKHLALAVLIDPHDATARGLMGLVAFEGGWKAPETIRETVLADTDLGRRLAEYHARRARAAYTADAQWNLALWCEANGLEDEARAHLTTVVRLDPAREAAWKRLGCRKAGGRWVGAEQLAAERAEAEAQRRADRAWKPLLAKYRDGLGARDDARRAEAEAALAHLDDPRAVPAVWATFARGNARGQAWAVRILTQIDGTEASRALAALAVFSPSAEVRRRTAESLRNRDPRDVVGWLIALIRKPLKYEVRPVGGPGSPGVLFVEGEKFNVQRLYAPPAMPNIPLYAGETVTFDEFGLPVISRSLGAWQREEQINGRIQRVGLDQYLGQAPSDPDTARFIDQARDNPRSRVDPSQPTEVTLRENIKRTTPEQTKVQIPIGQIVLEYQASAIAAQRQLIADIQAVERFNAGVTAANERVLPVLQGVTGQDRGADQQSWAAWWTDQQGYVYQPPAEVPRPTFLQNVPLAYTPQPVPVTTQVEQTGPATTTTTTTATDSRHHSCFRAGTPVRTLTGSTAIESIAVGDRVLVEDPTTGALSYQPVLAVYHNRPAPLYRVDLGEETVWATGIHRFWKAGTGWVMARDLKPGDVLRTLGGTARVASVETGPVERVFNLEVARGESFFVGNLGALVHDNSLVRPVARAFDAVTPVGDAASQR
jgi:hypothetical protein